MEITLSDLLAGKSTIIKTKEFNPTKTYVEPFLERMKTFTDDFRIQVKMPDQMSISQSNPDLVYNRVWIQAVLPEKYQIDHHQEVIGFLYGIDVKKPLVKIYKGYLNMACTNLCVFNPEWQNIQELTPGEPINYSPIKRVMESTNDFAVKLEKLKSTYLSRDERKNQLGEWVDFSLREAEDYGFGKVKLAVSTSINAYKDLYINSDSSYFIPQGIDPTLYDVYGAFTQVITSDSKDLMNKFDKTILINRLLGI